MPGTFSNDVLNPLVRGTDLERAQARAALVEILEGEVEGVLIASFLTALTAKGVKFIHYDFFKDQQDAAGVWTAPGGDKVAWFLDPDGNLAITDRLKDMYVSGGFNVYPAEVEAVLRRHPSVGQVAVVGVPDHRMGEVGLAVVVPTPGADVTALGDELPAFAKEQLANFKVPRRVEVVDALPANASGKVLKRELRATFTG